MATPLFSPFYKMKKSIPETHLFKFKAGCIAAIYGTSTLVHYILLYRPASFKNLKKMCFPLLLDPTSKRLFRDTSSKPISCNSPSIVFGSHSFYKKSKHVVPSQVPDMNTSHRAFIEAPCITDRQDVLNTRAGTTITPASIWQRAEANVNNATLFQM